MKILHVIPSLDPAAGGPPRIAVGLACGQVSLGHEVRMIAHEHAPPGRFQRGDYPLPHFDDVQVTLLPSPSLWERLWRPRDRGILREAVAWADVVHLHCVWESILLAAATGARARNTPYFVLLNGMLDPWSLRQKVLKKRIALALAHRRMLNGAAALHLGNVDEQRLIQPLGLTAPGVIIPNGVFLEELAPAPERGLFRRRYPELGDRPFVLFMSRLHYKKGLDYLADAFARVAAEQHELQLVVAGADDGGRADFERRVGELGVADRVHLVGPVYGEEKRAALAECACFCLPSRQEGFSVAITEAVASGTPVVISEGCHFPEVAEAGAGEVVALEVPAIAEALGRIVADEPLRQRMGDAGRALVEQRYTWPRIAEQAVAAYERALGSPPASGAT